MQVTIKHWTRNKRDWRLHWASWFCSISTSICLPAWLWPTFFVLLVHLLNAIVSILFSLPESLFLLLFRLLFTSEWPHKQLVRVQPSLARAGSTTTAWLGGVPLGLIWSPQLLQPFTFFSPSPLSSRFFLYGLWKNSLSKCLLVFLCLFNQSSFLSKPVITTNYCWVHIRQNVGRRCRKCSSVAEAVWDDRHVRCKS